MKRSLGLILVLSFCFIYSFLYADGTEVPFGTRGITLGKAFTAVADDASAMYWNPAGLSQLKGQGISYDSLGIFSNDKFKEENLAYAGDNTFVDKGASFVPSLAYYYSLDKFTLGFGIYAISGLSSDFSQTDVKMSAGIAILNIGPSIGYKINDKLSAGASIGIVKASNYVQGTATIPVYGSQDFVLRASGSNWNANLGLLYKVNDALKVGTSYRLPQRIILDGTLKFLGNERNYTSFTDVPGKFNLGTAYNWPQIKGLTSSLDISITQWNKALLDSDVDFKDLDLTAPDMKDFLTEAIFGSRTELNGRNNLTIGLGNEYKINDQWIARIGLMTEQPSTLAGDKTQPVEYLPKYTSISFGASYNVGKYGVSLGYGRMFAGELVNSSGTLSNHSGTYNRSVDLIMISLNVKI